MQPTAESSGQIVTFYSYKGGTGRTMALANVACLLARERTAGGRRVLMMDWDFEAPGLHRFFATRLHIADGTQARHETAIDSALGMLDLLVRLRDAAGDSNTPSPEASEEEADKFLASVELNEYILRTSLPRLALVKAGGPGTGRAHLSVGG